MKLLAALLLLWPLGAGAAAADEPKAATLKVSATAHGPNVLLKDVIAEELPAPLGAQVLKAVGRPGAKVTVARPFVQLKLKGGWRLQGAESCEVSAPAVTISGAKLQAFAADFLDQQLSGTAGASVEKAALPADINVYDAPTRLDIKAPVMDWRGHVVLRVRALQPGPQGDDREAASVPVSFVVRRREARVYAAKPIRKGDALDGSSLLLREEDTTFAPGGGFDSVEKLEGKQARAYIGAGRPVTQDLVELPAAIKRGDQVRLLVKSGAVIIETTAKALRDARVGETLPLELENKKQVQGRCVEAGIAVRDAL
jgi:flagella basal body P-ring formation protein FlgA